MTFWQFLAQAVTKAATEYAAGRITHQNVPVGTALLHAVSSSPQVQNPQTVAEKIAAIAVPLVAPHQPPHTAAAQLPDGLDQTSVALGAAMALAQVAGLGMPPINGGPIQAPPPTA